MPKAGQVVYYRSPWQLSLGLHHGACYHDVTNTNTRTHLPRALCRADFNMMLLEADTVASDTYIIIHMDAHTHYSNTHAHTHMH